MFRHRKNAYRRVAAILLVGLALRSLVAPGLMVVDGSEGFGGLSLVLCPGQNPGLDFDRLAGDGGHHKHHHNGGSIGFSPLQPDPEQSSGVHAESLDAGCALWVSSASDADLAAYKLPIGEAPQSAHPVAHHLARIGAALFRNHQPRAPPIIT